MAAVKWTGPSAAFSVLAALLLMALPSAAQLNCNAGVEYYPDGGGIERCVLNGHHTLFTAKGLKVTCADGTALTQYRDGALKSCEIDKRHSFDSTLCEPQSEVTFEPDGRFRACERLSRAAVCGHASILEASATGTPMGPMQSRSTALGKDFNEM